METKTTSRIINIHHLIWEFIIQVTKWWWLIILITALGTGAGAGYAVMKNRGAAQQGIGEEMRNGETVTQAISELEFAHVYNAAMIYDKIQVQREVIDNSRWMLYDDMNKVVLTCIVALDIDIETPNNKFIWGCLNQFESNELYENAAKAAGEEIQAQYLKPFIYYAYKDSANFTLQITSYNEESAQQIKDAIVQYLQKYMNDQKKKWENACALYILDEQIINYTDMGIADNKAGLETTFSSLQDTLNATLLAMTNVEKGYYEVYLTAREEEGYTPGQELTFFVEEEEEINETESQQEEEVVLTPEELAQKRLRTDTILGFILGFCLSIAIILIKYCWASKLVNGEELVRMYGVPVLGIVTKTEKKQSRLEKILRAKQRRMLKEKDLEQIASEATIRLKLSFNEEDKIYITGTQAESSFGTLISAGKKQGISYIGGENMLGFSPEIAEINYAAAVLLVETEGVSNYKEIDKEIQILREAGKNICGVVILA